jgi:DNA-binding transcriptional LysR family regulator
VCINWATRMANKQLNDSWDSFRYFLAVARTGTLSAAANQLQIEHTTVGRRIRMLEDELKSPLFHRSNQGYELTEAGQRLFLTAEVVESAVVSAKAEAVGEKQIAGTVRVGAPDGFGTVFLAPRLGALARLHRVVKKLRLLKGGSVPTFLVLGRCCTTSVPWTLEEGRRGSQAILDTAG